MTLRSLAGRALASLGAAGLAATMVVAGPRAAGPGVDDVANTRALLAAMRGTGPVPCGFALSVVEGNGGWGRWNGESGAGEDSASGALRDWLAQGLHDPAVVPLLREGLAPGDPCVRQAAARLLGRTHAAAAVTALVGALRDPDPSTRALGALGLGWTEAGAGYAPLIEALRDTVASVRATSALSLGRLGDRRASSALLPLLQQDRSPAVRRAAALALGSLD